MKRQVGFSQLVSEKDGSIRSQIVRSASQRDSKLWGVLLSSMLGQILECSLKSSAKGMGARCAPVGSVGSCFKRSNPDSGAP